MFAYNVAYGGLDLERFFKHLQEKKIKQMIQLSRAEIGRTLLGTPIYVFTVTRKKAHSTIRLNSLDVSDPMQRKHKTVNFGANYDYSRSIFSGSYEQKDRSLVFIAR